jgi:putative ABC transport system permease protein
MSWRRYIFRTRWDDERARELEAHLAIETDANIERGMSPAEARLAARRKLGNVKRIREDIYRMNTVGVLDAMWQDLRYGLRLLRLNPAFAIVAVLSLALGVGANTAIFQLLDAVRIRALPVAQAGQLAEIKIVNGDGRDGWFSGNHQILSNPIWQLVRERQEAFSDLFAWVDVDFELSAGG